MFNTFGREHPPGTTPAGIKHPGATLRLTSDDWERLLLLPADTWQYKVVLFLYGNRNRITENELRLANQDAQSLGGICRSVNKLLGEYADTFSPAARTGSHYKLGLISETSRLRAIRKVYW